MSTIPLPNHFGTKLFQPHIFLKFRDLRKKRERERVRERDREGESEIEKERERNKKEKKDGNNVLGSQEQKTNKVIFEFVLGS